ncbi:glycoside hydrolase family 76 protein [Acrodontium crateriforme]|uniref:Glycoside hydrolase family 76 protein n=1 Tax=Acrodontium crateriforme TaxID=150365 RepID=A0AAQ3M4B7_9PEZI|nr:glycoside hydrolase family 76 protein [Acrodontium crateriforme]
MLHLRFYTALLLVPLVAGHKSYFAEFEDTIQTLQLNYFNGTTWPDAENWQTAVLDTLLAASEISITNALQEYGGNVPGENPSPSDTPNVLIQKYFSNNVDAYGGEDVGQIFGDAYDDEQWVVLEWLEVLKFIHRYDDYASSDLGKSYIDEFAHRAHIFYDDVQKAYDTSLCDGGLTWQPKLATYKNAITNELFISSSIKMYLYFPGDTNTDGMPTPNTTTVRGQPIGPLPTLQAQDPSLLDNAKKEYEWFKSHNFLNSQGLVVDGFHISAGQTQCDQRNEMVYTYNQGVLLEGLRGLWEATGDVTYLNDGYTYINSVMNATGWNNGEPKTDGQWNGLGRNGYLEDYCDMDGSCSNDAMLFKGIYFHNLNTFCEALPTDQALIPGVTTTAPSSLASSHDNTCAGYKNWVQHNADGAINSRDPTTAIIGGWWAVNSPNTDSSKRSIISKPVLPAGAVDIINQPWILATDPWKCEGVDGCLVNENISIKRSAMSSDISKRSATQYTVQTQGSGLAVIEAASDFELKPAGYWRLK